MAYSLNEEHVTAAFRGGTLTDRGETITFKTHTVGTLQTPSGLIVACDPFVFFDVRPFPVAVPPGSHPVQLAVAFSNGDERVAFARVHLADPTTTSWELANAGDKDNADLAADEFFGYGVDSGTGCFMDPVAARLLSERFEQDDGYADQLIEAMEASYKHTWSWLDCRPQPNRDENVICFSSGFGDGSYPSFFGYSRNELLTELVTDFMVLPGYEDSSSPFQG
jgi:hypothetical protein